MGTMTDKQIQAWIRKGEHFDMRSDGGGLCLSFRDGFAMPVWRLRYRIAGKQRVIVMGSYKNMSLADARKEAKKLRGQVDNGQDPAAEKQARIASVRKELEAKQYEWTFKRLADEYVAKRVTGKLKHPNIIHNMLNRDILPRFGKTLVHEVKPLQIDAMLAAIRGRNAPTTATKTLRLIQKMLDYAVTRHITESNPASSFGVGDAGGREKARDRALSRSELIQLFEAMRITSGFSIQNHHTFKLLIILAVRKQELTMAKVVEFDLAAKVWRLPGNRTKTGAGIDIPLPDTAVDSIRELIRLGCSSHYLLPARKAQYLMLPHIHENTLNVALSKVKKNMPGVAPFTIHDFRRTARTQLASLGISSHVAERCLNHKLKGVEGIYNAHDYYDERRAALNLWAEVVEACEEGLEWRPADNVVAIRKSPTI
jgi:integrase